jgi:hypothetical protein
MSIYAYEMKLSAEEIAAKLGMKLEPGMTNTAKTDGVTNMGDENVDEVKCAVNG